MPAAQEQLFKSFGGPQSHGRSGRRAPRYQHRYSVLIAAIVVAEDVNQSRSSNRMPMTGGTASTPIKFAPYRARTVEGSRSDVVVSGVVDNGREIGHCNINANDPTETCSALYCCCAKLGIRGRSTRGNFLIDQIAPLAIGRRRSIQAECRSAPAPCAVVNHQAAGRHTVLHRAAQVQTFQRRRAARS